MSLVGFVHGFAEAFGLLEVPLPYSAPFDTMPPPSEPEPPPPSWHSHEVWSDVMWPAASLS